MRFAVTPEGVSQNGHLIWAPEVHAYYREVCVFYLISTSNAASATTLYTTMGSICESAGITSYCSYYVFGLHDTFLRMWVTDSSLFEFIQALETRFLDEINDIRDLRVDRIHYTFQGTPPTQEQIHKREDSIKEVALSFREGKADAVEPKVNALLAGGFLIRVPPASGLKAYFLLTAHSRTVSPAPADAEMRAILEACERTVLVNVSVYRCKSRWADYLVKGIAPSFEALQSIADGMTNELSPYDFKTWTIPIPDVPGVHEVDSLDSAVLDETPAARRLIAALVRNGLVDARKRLYELGGPSRDRVERIYEAYRTDLAYGEAGTYFLQFFGASLRHDEVELAHSMSFFLEVEALLKQLLPSLLVSHLGPRWKQLVDTELNASLTRSKPSKDLQPEESSLSEPFWRTKQLPKWSLAQILKYLTTAADISPELSSNLASTILFNDWRKNLHELIETRNRVSHGDMSNEFFSFAIDSEEWENDVRALFISARYYAALRALYLRRERR